MAEKLFLYRPTGVVGDWKSSCRSHCDWFYRNGGHLPLQGVDGIHWRVLSRLHAACQQTASVSFMSPLNAFHFGNSTPFKHHPHQTVFHSACNHIRTLISSRLLSVSTDHTYFSPSLRVFKFISRSLTVYYLGVHSVVFPLTSVHHSHPALRDLAPLSIQK